MKQETEAKIREFFEQNDHFAAQNGILTEEIDEGYAKASLTITKKHLNGAGVAHGGAIFLLADFALALASNSYGTLALGINNSISYLNAAQENEHIYAVAKEVEKNHKLASYTVTINGKDDRVIAIMQGMVYRKDKQFI